MSTMLTLIHDGWAVARRYAQSGRTVDALAHLTRLLACPDLPIGIATEARRLAAEIELGRERFASARRHLRAALALVPGDAEVCYLVARSFEEDPEGNDTRALRWYRKSVTLSPDSARYLAAFGRAAIRCDRVKRGVESLCIAAAQAPGDIAVLRIVVEGFLEAGKPSEARSAITRARFVCTARKELDQLDQRTRFEEARRVQRSTQEASTARDGGYSTLPFLRLVGGTTIRRDSASHARPHFRARIDRG